MAYVNGTTHYNLPQTVGTDKRDWADTNEAFAAVDAALYSATEDVADAQTEINGLKERMTTAEGNITTNTNDISALDGRLTTAEGTITQHTAQIADVRQDTEDMICAYNEASATSTHAYAVGDYFIYNDVLYRAIQAIAIGDTIVPDTNCTTTNVASELLTKGNAPITVIVNGRDYSTQNALLTAIHNIIMSQADVTLKDVKIFSNIDTRFRYIYSLTGFEYVDSAIDNLDFSVVTSGDAITLSSLHIVLRNSGSNSEYTWRITASDVTATTGDMTRQPNDSRWMIRIS